jgi:hypothetical protein
MDSETLFERLTERVVAANDDVVPGNMMSSPGLKCNDKVFAFYYEEAMCFRLGKAFDAEGFGLKTIRWLNPFKNKGPMKAWFIVGMEEHTLWEALAEEALAFTRTL